MNAFAACFDAAYAALVGSDNSAKSLSTIARPARSPRTAVARSAGRKLRHACTTPRKLTSIVRRKTSSGSASTGPAAEMPALHTRRCTAPCAASTASRASSTAAALATSQRCAVAFASPAAAASSAGSSTSSSATRAPRAAYSCASARPMPLAAPVITTVGEPDHPARPIVRIGERR